jgi:hypothetical protein
MSLFCGQIGQNILWSFGAGGEQRGRRVLTNYKGVRLPKLSPDWV